MSMLIALSLLPIVLGMIFLLAHIEARHLTARPAAQPRPPRRETPRHAD